MFRRKVHFPDKHCPASILSGVSRNITCVWVVVPRATARNTHRSATRCAEVAGQCRSLASKRYARDSWKHGWQRHHTTQTTNNNKQTREPGGSQRRTHRLFPMRCQAFRCRRERGRTARKLCVEPHHQRMPAQRKTIRKTATREGRTERGTAWETGTPSGSPFRHGDVYDHDDRMRRRRTTVCNVSSNDASKHTTLRLLWRTSGKGT